MLVVGTLVIAAHSNSFEASLIFDNAAIVGQYKRIRAAWRTAISAMLSRTPGRFEDGIAEFRAALRFSPDFGEVQHGAAHVNLRNVLVRVNRLTEAIAEYQDAIRLRPDLAEGDYDLGNALARTPGRVEDTIAEFRTALRTQPDRPEAHCRLLRIPGHFADAITEFETMQRIRPDPELKRLVDQLEAANR